MPIIVVCPSCNSKMKVPDNLVGKMVKCPSCAKAVPVNAAVPPPAPIPAPVPKKPVRPAPPPPVQPEPFEELEPVADEIEPPRRGRRPAVAEDEEVQVDDVRGEVSDKEKSTAMWIHLLPILLSCCCGIGTFVSLFMWTSKRKESPFIDHHGKTWLNWVINLFVVGVVLVLLTGGIGFVASTTVSSIISGIVWLPYAIVVVVMQIMLALKAKKGEWAEYKVLFKVLK